MAELDRTVLFSGRRDAVPGGGPNRAIDSSSKSSYYETPVPAISLHSIPKSFNQPLENLKFTGALWAGHDHVHGGLALTSKERTRG